MAVNRLMKISYITCLSFISLANSTKIFNQYTSENFSDVKSLSHDQNWMKFKFLLIRSDPALRENRVKNLFVLLGIKGNNHNEKQTIISPISQTRAKAKRERNNREFRKIDSIYSSKADTKERKGLITAPLSPDSKTPISKILSPTNSDSFEERSIDSDLTPNSLLDVKTEKNSNFGDRSKIPILLIALHSDIRRRSNLLRESDDNEGYDGISGSAIRETQNKSDKRAEEIQHTFSENYVPVLIRSTNRLITYNEDRENNKLLSSRSDDHKSNKWSLRSNQFDQQTITPANVQHKSITKSIIAPDLISANYETPVQPFHNGLHRINKLPQTPIIKTNNSNFISRRLGKKIPVILLPLIYKVDN